MTSASHGSSSLKNNAILRRRGEGKHFLSKNMLYNGSAITKAFVKGKEKLSNRMRVAREDSWYKLGMEVALSLLSTSIVIYILHHYWGILDYVL